MTEEEYDAQDEFVEYMQRVMKEENWTEEEFWEYYEARWEM